jgi:hypothetical protein
MSGMLEYARYDSHFLLGIYVIFVKLMCSDSFLTKEMPHLEPGILDLAKKDTNPWL